MKAFKLVCSQSQMTGFSFTFKKKVKHSLQGHHSKSDPIRLMCAPSVFKKVSMRAWLPVAECEGMYTT